MKAACQLMIMRCMLPSHMGRCGTCKRHVTLRHSNTVCCRDAVEAIVHLPDIHTKEYQPHMLDERTSSALERLQSSLDLVKSAAK